MGRFNAVDLSAIAPPDVVETLDYEVTLAARKADMAERLATIIPDWNPDRESDPIVKLIEANAYWDMVLRAHVNDAARAVLLATATGADLDHIAARYHVTRLVVDPGDDTAVPPVDPTYEDDAALRERVLMAFEALSVAGPEGAYIAAAKNADARVSDVAVTSPSPGEVLVTILSTEGDGTASADLLAVITAALTDEDVRPLTDLVTVQAGTRIDYAITAALDIYDGPDAEVVRAASEASANAFAAKQRKLGEPVTLDGVYAALRVDGVRESVLDEPAATVRPGETEFATCTAVTVTIGGA